MNTFHLTTPPDFSFQECLWFLDRNYDECLHTVSGDKVTKALWLGNARVVFELTGGKGGIQGNVLYQDEGLHIELLKAYVREWLDIDRSMQGFYELLDAHDALNYMPRDFHGLRMICIPELLEAICWCIIGQQINLSFAYKLKRRMVEQYGEKVVLGDSEHYLFPKAEVLAELDREDLKALQFSRQKADYVINTARLVAEGELSKEQIEQIGSREDKLAALTAVKGIGEWTANYVLMKTFKDMDCITIGDTGLNSALENHGLVKNKKDKAEVRQFFEAFQGWKSYLVIYLWRSLAVPPIDK